jgi:hypothetical protein
LQSQTRENIIASAIDLLSIFVAYRIGVQELGLLTGLAYGMFDAWIVVWQRERISKAISWVEMRIRIGPSRRRNILPWALD